MTNETSYLSAMNELFRWDSEGKLIYVEPALLRQITESLRDEQGLTVWERLDGCDRALVQLTSQVTVLQQQYAQMQNDLSLMASLQRTAIAHEAKIEALQKQLASSSTVEPPAVNGAVAGSIPASPATPLGTIDALVERVEKMFDCRNGYFGSYHQVGDQIFPYTTVGLLATATIPFAQDHLRQALYTSFLMLKRSCKSERPMLYWRYAKAMRIQEDTAGVVGAASPFPVQYKIMTRIAIPEADFSVIDRVVKAEYAPYVSLRE